MVKKAKQDQDFEGGLILLAELINHYRRKLPKEMIKELEELEELENDSKPEC